MVKVRTTKHYPDGTVEVTEKWVYESSREYDEACVYNREHCIKYKDGYERLDSNAVKEATMRDIMDAFRDFTEMLNNLS